MNATLDLQTALRKHLLSSADVTLVLGAHAVFDEVPQGTPFPYLYMGDIETRDWSTQTKRGHEHSVGIHVWSDYCGRKQALNIIEAVDTALEDAALPLADHTLISLKTLFWTVLHELNRGLYHGIMRLRVVTESNS
ncbi:MAG TPA: DUF3168 domain-containing protein [Aestuariivirgaceae bacterium]|jgi:hypothetical protein